jgi:hypothetical protein
MKQLIHYHLEYQTLHISHEELLNELLICEPICRKEEVNNLVLQPMLRNGVICPSFERK